MEGKRAETPDQLCPLNFKPWLAYSICSHYYAFLVTGDTVKKPLCRCLLKYTVVHEGCTSAGLLFLFVRLSRSCWTRCKDDRKQMSA